MTQIKISGKHGEIHNISYSCLNTSNCSYVQLFFSTGVFSVELWGAGLTAGGGYVYGEIQMLKKQILYLFIGGVAQTDEKLIGIGGYNGGGTSKVIGKSGDSGGRTRQIGGDGATDIRLEPKNLSSRIIVAGGSGGGFANEIPGGFGGGLVGGDGSGSNGLIIGMGGTQSEGGKGDFQGSFGIGAPSCPTSSTDLAGSGGGGWYGGGSGYHHNYLASGGGGSSYISGNDGCALHHSGLRFLNSTIIPGNSEMPLFFVGKGYGPFGNGFCRIKCIRQIITHQSKFKKSYFFLKFIMIFCQK